ncbi:MAG: hypothetical protein ACXW4C_10125 [Nitrospira sp.]
MAGYDSFRSIGPVMANVNATGLRTALRRRNLGAELPLLAGSGLSRGLCRLNDLSDEVTVNAN